MNSGYFGVYCKIFQCPISSLRVSPVHFLKELIDGTCLFQAIEKGRFQTVCQILLLASLDLRPIGTTFAGLALALLVFVPEAWSACTCGGSGTVPCGVVCCSSSTYCNAGNICADGGCLSKSSARVCGDGRYCNAGEVCTPENTCISQTSERYCGDRRFCATGLACIGGGKCLSVLSERYCGNRKFCAEGHYCTSDGRCGSRAADEAARRLRELQEMQEQLAAEQRQQEAEEEQRRRAEAEAQREEQRRQAAREEERRRAEFQRQAREKQAATQRPRTPGAKSAPVSCSTITDRNHPSTGPCATASTKLAAAKASRASAPVQAARDYRDAAQSYKQASDILGAIAAIKEARTIEAAPAPAAASPRIVLLPPPTCKYCGALVTLGEVVPELAEKLRDIKFDSFDEPEPPLFDGGPNTLRPYLPRRPLHAVSKPDDPIEFFEELKDASDNYESVRELWDKPEQAEEFDKQCRNGFVGSVWKSFRTRDYGEKAKAAWDSLKNCWKAAFDKMVEDLTADPTSPEDKQ